MDSYRSSDSNISSSASYNLISREEFDSSSLICVLLNFAKGIFAVVAFISFAHFLNALIVKNVGDYWTVSLVIGSLVFIIWASFVGREHKKIVRDYRRQEARKRQELHGKYG